MWLFNWKRNQGENFEKSKTWLNHIKEFLGLKTNVDTIKNDLGDLGNQVVDNHNDINEVIGSIETVKQEFNNLKSEFDNFKNRFQIDDNGFSFVSLNSDVIMNVDENGLFVKNNKIVDENFLTKNYYSKIDLSNYSVLLNVRELSVGPNEKNILFYVYFSTLNELIILMSNSNKISMQGKNGHSIIQENGGPWRLT